MMKGLVSVALMATTPALGADTYGRFEPLGEGASTCKSFLAGRYRERDRSWLAGYFSAVAATTQGATDGTFGNGMAVVEAAIRLACTQSPAARLAEPAVYVARELKGAADAKLGKTTTP